jgi:hypothetical protein
MGVWIDKSGCDDHPSRINRTRGGDTRLLGVADENDAIAANRDISFASLPARTINQFAVQNQNVDLIRSACDNGRRCKVRHYGQKQDAGDEIRESLNHMNNQGDRLLSEL